MKQREVLAKVLGKHIFEKAERFLHTNDLNLSNNLHQFSVPSHKPASLTNLVIKLVCKLRFGRTDKIVFDQNNNHI